MKTEHCNEFPFIENKHTPLIIHSLQRALGAEELAKSIRGRGACQEHQGPRSSQRALGAEELVKSIRGRGACQAHWGPSIRCKSIRCKKH